MMTSKSHAFLVLIATIISRAAAHQQALPEWRPALQTLGLDSDDRPHLQFSPRPTDSPRVDADDLLRRQETSIATNICGFLTRNNKAFPCEEGLTCTNIGDYRGCCRGDNCLTLPFSSVCLDATEPACSASTPGTLCCTRKADKSYCVTYLWATTATPNRVFSLFVCDSENFAGQQILDSEPQGLAITTASDPPATSTGPSSSSSDSSSSKGSSSSNGSPSPSGSSSASGSPSSNESGSNGSSSSGSSNAPAESNKSSGSGTPVGAIVGGVVGGLAVISIAVLGAVLLVLRGRKNKANANKGDFADQQPPPMSAYPSSAYTTSGYHPISSYGQSPSEVPGPDQIPGAFAAYPKYPSSSESGGISEAPAGNPLGMGSNPDRVELPP